MHILKLNRSLILGGVAALTLLTSHQLMAQGRGGPPDPAEIKQRRLEAAQEQMEITNKEDWKAIEPLIGKVIDAQMDVMRAGAGMFGRGGRRGGGEGANNGADRPPRRNFFGEPSASMTALRDAIDSKASTADLKAKLAAVRAETKAREDKLEAARKDLRDVLTVRQEAIAVSMGLLQ
jgi:hypothetical protein